MFCFQLAFGRWKTGLAKSACYAKCVPIWSDWILQKMSRYSAKAAQNTLQWEALVEWRGAIVLPFAFAEPFTKQFRTSHKKICVGPGPSRLCRFDVSWQLVQDDGCQYFWLEGMLTIWLVQSDMERHRAEENRVQLILIRDDGDNWLITGSGRKDPTVLRKDKFTACFVFLEMHLVSAAPIAPGPVVILNCSDFTARYSDNLLCRQEIIRE